MKRTSWNSTLPRRSAPLPRGSGPRPSGGPLKHRRRGRKGYASLRDPLFKAWVRARPCLLAGRRRHQCSGRVEFAHLENEGNGGSDWGNGLPLCSGAHTGDATSWHVMGKTSWPKYWGINPYSVALELAAAYDQEQGGR